jgi:hypothetical protein
VSAARHKLQDRLVSHEPDVFGLVRERRKKTACSVTSGPRARSIAARRCSQPRAAQVSPCSP